MMFVFIFGLVLFQILAPLSGHPIIGEQSGKGTTYGEKIVPRDITSTSTIPVSHDEYQPTSMKPAVESPPYQTTTPSLMSKEEPVSVVPYIDEVQDRWSRKPETKGSSWTYKDPGAWSARYPTCGGKQQSPIDIQPKSTVLTAYPKFTFHNYGELEDMLLTNNGHTALYSLPNDFSSDKIPYITGGGLADRYDFVQFHLHWGSDSSKGSEHVIQSKSYPAELHLVHYNTKYGSFAEASKYSDDGLAVLGVFFKIDPEDNLALEPLVNQLNEITKSGDETILKKRISLDQLIPKRTNSFYRYSGSLTTPACQEIVVWTVFDNPILVSERQLIKFRKLIADDGKALVDNFRPPMPVNGRTIHYRSFTGCEIPRSWPVSSSPFSDAYKWSKCLMGYAFKSLTPSALQI